MSNPAEIEFVCYAEGGFIDLHRALEDLLPQRLLKLPPEFEAESDLDSTPRTFKPAVRPLDLHIGIDDLQRQHLQRFPVFERSTEDDWAETAFTPAPTIERVYPFKKAIEAEAPARELAPFLEAIPTNSDRMSPTDWIVESAAVAGEDLPRKPIARPVPTLPAYQSQRAFHDQLVARSLERDEARRRGLASKPKWRKLKNGRNVMLRIVGELIVLTGGGAIGAGMMALRPLESRSQTAWFVVASGIAAVAISLLLRQIPRAWSKSRMTAAQI